ncbi:MAG TPA: GNAT family N-acetyltransferase [Pseudonocardiaceae bacterium]
MTVLLSAKASGRAPAVLLRPWRRTDLPALLDAHRDDQMRRSLVNPLTDERSGSQWLSAQIAGWSTSTRFGFAVLAEDISAEPIGHLSITSGADPTTEAVSSAESAEVGYWVAAKARGRGIASRALDIATNWAFSARCDLPLTRLELLHSVDNHASCRVAGNCGYLLHSILPPEPPMFPAEGHRHVREQYN